MLAALSKPIQQFIRLESAGGLLLLGAAVLALITANSPLRELYDQLLHLDVVVQIGALAIDKPLLLWINDGLMAVFFFLIGLEIKREFLEGELSSMDQVVLPAAGALGGCLYRRLFMHGSIGAPRLRCMAGLFRWRRILRSRLGC